MARNKSPNDFPDDVMPGEKPLHQWDYAEKERGMVGDIVAERSNAFRPSIQYTTMQRGKLYWPKEKMLPGYQYAWVRIRLDNQDDVDNFHDALMNDWVPVPHSDHPEYKCINAFNDVIEERFPGSIRRGGLILVKKPIDLFKAQDEYYRQVAEEEQKSSSALTEYGKSPNAAPTGIVENSGRYVQRGRVQ